VWPGEGSATATAGWRHCRLHNCSARRGAEKGRGRIEKGKPAAGVEKRGALGHETARALHMPRLRDDRLVHS